MAETAAPAAKPPMKLGLHWDVNTAVAALVLGSLAFIVALRAGFRPALITS